ncbi:MAG: response regulator [Eubacteriales bacterium]|nr:response regulator [Eubacteriales bacterium]
MNVLVADDEFYARKAIVKMLTDCSDTVHICGDFETGREIVDFLEAETEPVDVIFTDIKMPEMDGLRLACWLQENRPEIFVVIITGYADFEYARQAIQYQVHDYVTKPVDKLELRRIVNTLLGQQQEKNRREAKLRTQLFELSREQLSFKEITQKAELRGEFFPCAPADIDTRAWRLVLVQLSHDGEKETLEKIRQTMASVLKLDIVQALYLRTNDEFLALGLAENIGGQHGMRHAMEKIVCALESLSFTDITAAASGEHQSTGALYTAYKEAVYAMNMRLLENDSVYLYNEALEKTCEKNYVAETVLQSAVDSRDTASVKKCIHSILFTENKMSVQQLYKRLVRILEILEHAYEAEDGSVPKSEYLMFSRRYDLYSFRKVEQLEAYFDSLAEVVCGQSMGRPDVVQDIMGYIERSYQYDISLQELAEKKYFMNISYLSRLFKTQVGKTFSKYLIEFRLEKSTELLRETILKVSDIAAHVGYNDVSHFIQSFRKAYDMTPEEYRAACRVRGVE